MVKEEQMNDVEKISKLIAEGKLAAKTIEYHCFGDRDHPYTIKPGPNFVTVFHIKGCAFIKDHNDDCDCDPEIVLPRLN